jgi:hypothetical protein
MRKTGELMVGAASSRDHQDRGSLLMKSLLFNSVGAAFQPRKSKLKASPTSTNLYNRLLIIERFKLNDKKPNI